MARNRYCQDKFVPKNPKKYTGTYPIIYRSQWELSVMNFFDTNRSIISWSSESIEIPYADPISNKWRTYYPDFIVKYKKGSKEVVELIEVKPLCQTSMQHAKTKRDKEAVILNEAKWNYATRWCDKNNIKFRILTEKDIYL